MKQAKDTCQSLNKEISSIQSDLFKLKQQNEADKPVDIGALEDDEERFQVISNGSSDFSVIDVYFSFLKCYLLSSKLKGLAQNGRKTQVLNFSSIWRQKITPHSMPRGLWMKFKILSMGPSQGKRSCIRG